MKSVCRKLLNLSIFKYLYVPYIKRTGTYFMFRNEISYIAVCDPCYFIFSLITFISFFINVNVRNNCMTDRLHPF